MLDEQTKALVRVALFKDNLPVYVTCNWAAINGHLNVLKWKWVFVE